jgi:hypothetical protein
MFPPLKMAPGRYSETAIGLQKLLPMVYRLSSPVKVLFGGGFT